MSETSWKIYIDSPSTWEAMLDECRKARKNIDLAQFIFVDDEIGKKFIEVFEERAKNGVRVRLIWDAAGSFSFFGSALAENLKSKGIELIFFKTLLPGFFTIHDYRSWYFRNHMRTLIIDEEVGFTGSICISKYTEDWRETTVKIEGNVIKEMQESFNRSWEQALGNKVSRIYYNKTNNKEFKYVINTPLPRNRYLYRDIITAINNSQKYVHITVPYFVPTTKIVHLLHKIALDGIEVKIILTERSDHPIVDLAARTYFKNLLKAGVKIYLYGGKILHSKTVVVDGNWSTLGTMNMDRVSLLYNFEGNIVSTNKDFAKELDIHFLNDINKSKEITLEDWTKRYFFEKIAGFFIKFIRIFL